MVEGTQEYEVEIVMHGEEVAEVYCICPYVNDGNHFKDRTAVLYEIEDSDVSKSTLMIEGKPDWEKIKRGA